METFLTIFMGHDVGSYPLLLCGLRLRDVTSGSLGRSHVGYNITTGTGSRSTELTFPFPGESVPAIFSRPLMRVGRASMAPRSRGVLRCVASRRVAFRSAASRRRRLGETERERR